MFKKLSRRRGGTMVEFVFMVPFYATMLFGTLEFGQVFYDRVQLSNACREGARRAALGWTLSDIKTTTIAAAPNLSLTTDQIVIESSSDSGSTWSAAADSSDGTTNAITTGDLCRVRTSGWYHKLLTGSYFSFLPTYTSSGLSMSGSVVMTRE